MTEHRWDRTKALRHSALLSAGALGAFVCNFAKGLVTPWVLDPIGYGTLNVLSLVILYAGYLQLGMKHSATLLMPSALRDGRTGEVEELRDSIFTVENLLSLTVVAGLWVLYGFGVRFGVLDRFFVIAISAIVLLQRLDLLLVSYLKGLGRFRVLAQNQFFTSFVGMVVGIPLLLAYGIEGLIASMIVPYVLVDGYIIWKERIRFRIRLDVRQIRDYTRIGFPVYVGNFVGQYLWTLEKTLIAFLLSTTELGIYSFALLVFGPINIVPKSFNEVIKRRMAEFRGEASLGASSPLLRFFRYPMAAYLALSVVLGGTAFFFYRVLVARVYPEYGASVFVLTILLFGFPYFQMRLFAGYPLNILNRSWLFVGVQAAALVVNGILDYLLILRFGLVGAAVGCTVSYVLFGYAILYATHRAIAPERAVRDALRSFGRVTIAWSAAFLVLLGLVRGGDVLVPAFPGVVGWSVDLGVAGLSSLAFGSSALLFFALVYRADDFYRHTRGIVRETVSMMVGRVVAAPSGSGDATT